MTKGAVGVGEGEGGGGEGSEGGRGVLFASNLTWDLS